MKRVRIDTAAPPQDPDGDLTERTMYTVQLGNGVRLYFSSQRNALAFQAEASRYATELMLSVNLLLSEAFVAYRMAWPYFPPGDGLQGYVRDAEAALDRAAKVNGPNAVYFRWQALSAALGSIRFMALELVKVYMVKSHAVPRHQAQLLAERAGLLVNELATYGTDHDAAVSTKVPRR